MPHKFPAPINVKRIRGDTAAEKFSVDPLLYGTTAALTVEGLGNLQGSVDVPQRMISFPVTIDGVANGVAGQYDYKVVITESGLTRTIIEGKWVIREPSA